MPVPEQNPYTIVKFWGPEQECYGFDRGDDGDMYVVVTSRGDVMTGIPGVCLKQNVIGFSVKGERLMFKYKNSEQQEGEICFGRILDQTAAQQWVETVNRLFQ